MKKVGNDLSYNPEKIIGEGSYGTVYEGLFLISGSRGKKQSVAVKRILKRRETDESIILREVDIMKKAIHPNILHVIATEKNEDFV